jgi:hypothetical protein
MLSEPNTGANYAIILKRYAPYGRGYSESNEPSHCSVNLASSHMPERHFYSRMGHHSYGSLPWVTWWGGGCNETKNHSGIDMRYGRSL